MVKCDHCYENAIYIMGTDVLCQRHYRHFHPNNFPIMSKERVDVPKIDCEIVFNRKYTNRMLHFKTNEEYLSILDEFKKDVRIVKRKTKLYND